jgi:hypothetical protein
MREPEQMQVVIGELIVRTLGALVWIESLCISSLAANTIYILVFLITELQCSRNRVTIILT